MFTPQEIQEQTFSKAVFGGYDMQQVDDFLEPLTEDYITLYKENSVLKAKMKILVEKLEEYRAQETQQSSATAEAEAKSAQLLKQTQAKCAAMLQNAEVNAQANAQVNAANVQLAQLNQQIHAEQERLDYAKQTALNFISVIERDVQGHLGLLETLKSRDLTKEEAPAQPKSAHEKPYDWQADKTEPACERHAKDGTSIDARAQRRFGHLTCVRHGIHSFQTGRSTHRFQVPRTAQEQRHSSRRLPAVQARARGS